MVEFSIHDEFGGCKHWGNRGLLQWTKVILSSHSHIQVDFTTLSTHWLKYSGVALAATSETPTVLVSKFSQLLCSLPKSTSRMVLNLTFRSTSTYMLFSSLFLSRSTFSSLPFHPLHSPPLYSPPLSSPPSTPLLSLPCLPCFLSLSLPLLPTPPIFSKCL